MIDKFAKIRAVLCFIMIIIVISNFAICSYADENADQKSILILNSYHQGTKWTREETDGILDTLNDGKFNLSISVEYMDWKNYPTKENLEHLENSYSFKYKDQHIDLIIATDDAALEFALAHRERLFSNAPVVFCGVNKNGIEKITRGFHNFTGILEEVDPVPTLEAALTINPDLRKVYVLFDNSESGISTGQLVLDKITSYGNLKAIPLDDLSFDKITENVKHYDNNSIILATTYYSDADGRIIDFEYASRTLGRYSRVPVYHLYDMGMNNGAFGGNMLCGKLQGENAANLALRVLHGEAADTIPILKAETTLRLFDYEQLKRFDISLNKVPKDYKIINKPFSFFETYKSLVYAVLAVIIILDAFILMLLLNIRKMKQMKKELTDNHDELRFHYNELLANQQKLKTTEERLAFLAYHDTLTGLPNKLSLFESALSLEKTALLFIDIDNFKYINDTMGHESGDQLIIKACERLTALLKNGCCLYRLSGDEFVIIIQDIKDKYDAEIFASHILAGFKEEFHISSSVLHISLSIGIAIYPDHGQSLDELLKHSDIAMYCAKAEGRNKYIVYDNLMNDAFTERVSIEKHLHAALGKNEFELYYQPQLDLKLNKVTGFEALLRWKSPELGPVSPLKFIKVAEDTHLIIPLGAWVLKTACAFLKNIIHQGFDDLTISVNISMLQILQTDFIDMVKDTLELYGLMPHQLELEVTETILIESFEAVGKKLGELHDYGIKIALDDFGKGYSSLSYLTNLPISTLKIDKSFVDNIPNDNDVLTRHIVSLGRSMGMIVVAEGVEREDQLEYLVQNDCHKIQGYLFSRPVPESEAVKLLEPRDNKL